MRSRRPGPRDDEPAAWLQDAVDIGIYRRPVQAIVHRTVHDHHVRDGQAEANRGGIASYEEACPGRCVDRLPRGLERLATGIDEDGATRMPDGLGDLRGVAAAAAPDGDNDVARIRSAARNRRPRCATSGEQPVSAGSSTPSTRWPFERCTDRSRCRIRASARADRRGCGVLPRSRMEASSPRVLGGSRRDFLTCIPLTQRLRKRRCIAPSHLPDSAQIPAIRELAPALHVATSSEHYIATTDVGV